MRRLQLLERSQLEAETETDRITSFWEARPDAITFGHVISMCVVESTGIMGMVHGMVP